MRTVKIFLASSAELEGDREQFRLSIADLNDNWLHRGVILQVVAWENFLDAMAKTRLQDEYNRALRECDVFVMLFWTKVGPYTREEFETAFGQFSAQGRPFVYTYFRTTPPAADVPAADRESLLAFQRRLKELGHFKTVYDSADRLNLHFQRQLDRLAVKGFIEFAADDPTPRQRPAVPLQAPPVSADHVPRPTEIAPLKARFIAADGQLAPVTVGLHGMGGVGKTTLARLLCADADIVAACRDGILWTAIGTRAGDARERLASLVAALTGDAEGCGSLDAARSRLRAELSGRRVLLVIDDIWDESHVRELLDASTGCARLLTTRRPATLPFGTVRVDVGTMADADAAALLGLGLGAGGDAGRIDALAARLGRWPVLLRLANRRLREEVAQGSTVDAAIDAATATLERRGIEAFDAGSQAGARDQAVAATIEASLGLLSADEQARYAELAIFPQDLPIPLAQVAELWRISAGLDEDECHDLVATRLDAMSLLDYDGARGTIALHDVLRRYLVARLGAGRGALHARLAAHWTDRPSRGRRYAWRWLAHHLAQAAIAAPAAERHERAVALVDLVADPGWQHQHQAALQDLPALRDALRRALDAAIADDSAAGLPLLVRAADAWVQFGRDHERAAPAFDAACHGQLDVARRRAELLSIDADWRLALLLMVVWQAPPDTPQRQSLFDELRAEAERGGPLADLAAWVRADVEAAVAPRFGPPALPRPVSPELIESLLQRLGGGAIDFEFLHAHGIDTPGASAEMTTLGVAPGRVGSPDDPGSPSQYLAQQDAPWLVAFALADRVAGRAALDRYLGVFAGYGYAEYRQSSCWWLLAAFARFPDPDAAPWLRDAIAAIIETAVGGGSVQFEHAVRVAAQAFAAQAGDADAEAALHAAATSAADEASRRQSGRERGDTWGHCKRMLAALAEALGWLRGDVVGADYLVGRALALADSGFAGYQAPACLALAETVRVLREGDPPPDDDRITSALEAAQQAAHNVQDPTFCARTTARVNALRRHWWPAVDAVQRARQLRGGALGAEFCGLHRVGHAYVGRRPGALPSPAQEFDDRRLDSLQALYKRPWDEIARLNDPAAHLKPGDEVSVPDPGLAPLAATRIAAELLARADGAPLAESRRQLLRALVAVALPNPTALDTLLARVVLACARDGATAEQAAALYAVLEARPAVAAPTQGPETLARVPA